MALTGTVNISWSVNGADNVRCVVTKSQDAEVSIEDLAVTMPVTDKQYTIAIDVSALELIVIMCTKDATLETNSAGSPADTITLKAKEPYIWWKNAPWVNKLTTDVTAFYLTVAGTGTFDFHVAALQDPTP